MVMASGLALGALSLHVVGPGPGLMAMWALALLVAGSGVGAAWPYLSAWAMSSVDAPAEGPAAAAAINTVQLICGAFGAGFAGMVVNLNESNDTSAASWLFASFAVLAGSATVAAVRASGYIAVAGRSLWARFKTYAAGSPSRVEVAWSSTAPSSMPPGSFGSGPISRR